MRSTNRSSTAPEMLRLNIALSMYLKKHETRCMHALMAATEHGQTAVSVMHARRSERECMSVWDRMHCAV